MRTPAAHVVASIVGAVALSFLSCRAATQITFEVTTDLACSDIQGTTIAVGALAGLDDRAPTASAGPCVGGRIGGLVVVPSGAKDDEVAVRIVSGVDVPAEQCTPTTARSCIVAKRALRFIPHEGLTVKVPMSRACKGVVCPADQTCVAGACRPARIDDSSLCTGDGCGESVLGGPDGGVDATLDGAADATVDATVDATNDGAFDGSVVATIGELGMSDETTCAILDGGGVTCWGGNTSGELGQGTMDDGSVVPMTIPGFTGIARLGGSGSGGHMCARMNDGTVRCWGYNGNAELGTGHPNGVDTAPTPVGGLAGVAELAIGETHTCARAADGSNVWCWGYSGASRIDALPVPVAAFVDAGARQVVAAWQLTCVLVADGTTQCWGDQNGYGPLGPSVPLDAGTQTPTPIPVLANVALLAAGGEHACALVGAAHDLWCWGENTYGQLGIGTMGDIHTTPVSVGLTGVLGLALGINHTCALLADATVSCWGVNDSGQLGRGSGAFDATMPGTLMGIDHVAAIYAGRDHTCARRGDDGTLWCWGLNNRGQLGDRSVTNRNAPVPVQL